MVDFKDRLKEALHIRGMSAAELSRRSNIPESNISQYIHGYCEPKVNKLGRLANALEVDEGWLMGFDTPMDKYDPSHHRPKPSINEGDVKEFLFGTRDVSEEVWKQALLMIAFLKNNIN